MVPRQAHALCKPYWQIPSYLPVSPNFLNIPPCPPLDPQALLPPWAPPPLAMHLWAPLRIAVSKPSQHAQQHRVAIAEHVSTYAYLFRGLMLSMTHRVHAAIVPIPLLSCPLSLPYTCTNSYHSAIREALCMLAEQAIGHLQRAHISVAQ